MKWKRWLTALLCVTLWAAPLGSVGEDALDERLTQVLDQLESGEDLQGLYARMDAAMQSALSLEDLGGLWGSLTALGGSFIGYDGGTAATEQNGYTVLTQRLDMTGMDLLFTLSLNDEGRIAGMQFTLAPAQAADAAQPKGVLEEELTVGQAPWALPGTLTLPQGDGPWPAVVLVHGSGPSDRNESIGGLKPFQDIAWGLAQRGIATLRYDKRTYVCGSEIAASADYAAFTVEEETIQDAIAAGRLLAADPRVEQVYLLGHSLGAMLAPRIMAESDGLFAGMILACGSNLPLTEIMLRQSADAVAALPEGAQRDAQEALLEQARAQCAGLADLTAQEAQAQTLLGQPAYYFWEMAQHPAPAELIAQLEAPTLLINGERDFQVTPEEGKGSWSQALDLDAPYLTHLWTDVNHLLMRPEADADIAGTAAEYAVPCSVAADVLDALADWIAKERK